MQIHSYKTIEFSEIPLSELSNDLRIDAEFYQPKYLRALEAIQSAGSEHLGSLQTEIIHPTEITRTYSDEGIQILLAQNIRDNVLEFNNKVFMPESKRKTLSRNKLIANDVVMTRSGANYGQTAYYLDDPLEIFACADCLVIRTPRLNGLYLSTFLNCSYGKLLVDRGSYGMAQPHIAPSYLYKLQVPLPSSVFQKKLEKLIKYSFEQKQLAEKLYKDAELLLLSELGLLDWKPDTVKFTHGGIAFEVEDTISAVQSPTVFETVRIDAEYFNPRVQKLLQLLGQQHLSIGSAAKLRKESFKPKNHDTFEYLEISNITTDGEITGYTVPAAEAPDRATWYVREGDIITSTVRPVRRLSAIIKPEQDGFVCSSGFAVLEPLHIPSELLLVYLRLPVIAELMDLYTTASLYPAISVTNILRIPFAKPKAEAVTSITQGVKTSFAARAKSSQLLELAKRAVELFIEEGEEAALQAVARAAQ